MTQLLPKRRLRIDGAALAGGLNDVFERDANRQTIERVVKYLRPVYEQYSARSWADISRKHTQTEEFFLQMPTEAAFADEMRLVEAIELHGQGAMSDLDIKAVLDDFISSHTFVYFEDERTCKTGNWHLWAETELAYLVDVKNDFGFVCNPIQAKLTKLLHQDLEIKIVKL